MAISLGSLFVELGLNAAEFVSGMEISRKSLKSFGNEVTDSLQEIGGLASQLLGPFGELGTVVGETLGKVGEAAGGAIRQFSQLGGTLGAIGGVAAGAAAGLAVIEAGAVGLAIHTAEAQAKLGELSASTGVSTEALAALGLAAKEHGVDIELLAKSLEIFNTNIIKANQTTAGTPSVFQRLGVSVKDAQGQIKDTTTLFLESAEKVSNLPEGPEEGYFARALFGKGGASLIPVLNENKAKIQEIVELAKNIGLGDPQTIAASQQFSTTVTEIGAEFEGIALRLTKDLLPTLQFIATRIAEAFKTGQLQSFIDKIADLVKGTIAAGSVIDSVFTQVGDFVQGIINEAGNVLITLAKMEDRFNHLDFSGMKKEAQNGLANVGNIVDQFFDKSKKNWQDNAKFIAGIFAPLPNLQPERSRTGTADLGPSQADARVAEINKIIDALRTRTEAELNLAQTVDQSVAAQKLQQAAGQADQIIAQLVAVANKAQGEERRKLIAIILDQTLAIRGLTAAEQFAKDAVATGAELQKSIDSANAQTKSLLAMAAAYKEGGAAIADADIDSKLEGQTKKVADLAEELALLSHNQGVTTSDFFKASDALAAETQKLDALRIATEKARAAKYSDEIEKQIAGFTGSLPLIEALDVAYSQNEAAIRRARVELELYNFQFAHPGATVDQLRQVRAELEAEAAAAYQAQLAQQAGQYSLSALYDKSIRQLEIVREDMKSLGSDTLLVDAQIYDEQQRFIEQWDTAALKVGNFRDKFRAVANQIIIDGQNLGEKIFTAIGKAIDDLSTQIAKFAVEGKANFTALIQGLEESIVKAGLQKLFSQIIGGSGPISDIAKALGLPGTAPDGSSSKPFHVIIDASLLAAPSVAGGGSGVSVGGGFLGFLGKLFGVGGNSGAPLEGINASPEGSFSAVPWSGEFANGGDMFPGHAYLVGEQHPEILLAGSSGGTVVPTMDAGKNFVFSPTYVIQTPNPDAFQKSGPQMIAESYSQARLFFARNSGNGGAF